MLKPVHNLLLTLLVIACNSSPDYGGGKQLKDSLSHLAVDSLNLPQDHEILGQDFAKRQLNDLLKGKGQPFTWDTLIKSHSTAIAIAEPLLYDLFGKQQILNERPYEVYLVDGYWYISGTMPKGSKGGAFEIIFSARDGKIIRVTHYK